MGVESISYNVLARSVTLERYYCNWTQFCAHIPFTISRMFSEAEEYGWQSGGCTR